ncbi:unnamed protein product, partial [Gongylonema pulchrum]|uniref:Fibronectin type-III domain-containing protein n=1 Tax=Gongylonema pulchrum TaxID=637853 RepID=A0A183E0Z9_9BILA
MRTEQVPGTFFSHIISQLSPYSIYNISVRAGTDYGELGLPSSKVISLQQYMGNVIPELPIRTADLEKDRAEQEEQRRRQEQERERERQRIEQE